MKWYHETVVLPFINTLRKVNLNVESRVSDNITGGGDLYHKWTNYEFDSEILYLSYLNRKETVMLNHQNRVMVKKIVQREQKTIILWIVVMFF